MSGGVPGFDGPVDLSNCDREPIHLLGHIQPFGFLIAVSMDWLIQHVSANIGEFLACDPETLPGENLLNVLPENAIHSIRGRLQMLAAGEGTERLFGCDLLGDERPFDVAVHVSGSTILIEAEPAETTMAINPSAMVKSMIARIQKAATLTDLHKNAVRQLRGVTGFDRVMLYRFAESGSGEVVAESVRSGLETFLGLNYPATDIPAQARQLYIRNQIRIISDVGAVTVPIEPPLDPLGKPLDLSLSLLRSVSPIHIEYLQNMGVAASFSISIVIGGKLWGLFAFHHYAPRHLSMEMRSALELFGQMVSFMIEARLYSERRQMEETTREVHDRFLSKIVAATGSVEALGDYADELREIIPCDGLMVWAKGEARRFGRTPTEDEMPGLARFLNRAAASRIYGTDELGFLYPPAQDFADRAAGILAIPISRSPRDYVIFCRGEVVRTVDWAGDPRSKPVTTGPNGPRLTPRKSFEAWRETVRGKSIPWTPSELKAADALRVSILEVLIRYNEESERQKQLASERQELLIAELNHRVRNILGLMRALVSQSRPGAKSIDDFAAIIGGRIQALARAHDQITSDNASAISLAEIVSTEVSAYIGAKASRVHLSGPDIHVEARAFSTLALVFHEMVTNSAKYGALSDSHGSISVQWRIEDDGGCRIEWRESGGPAVTAPTRRGFGSTIIERAIPHDLQGSAQLRYRLPGLEADFTLPAGVFHPVAPEMARLAAASKETARMASVANPSSLSGMTGLIVEDNMIISMDAEQLMLDNGMTQVFVAASVAEARKIIVRETLDVALLDVNLGNETSFPLVGDLKARNVPFVFVTGYGENVDLPVEANGARAIKKPFASDQLIDALGTAARSERAVPTTSND
ncbi:MULTISPECIES: HWE histidine kinase domain-containing protein [unclassified Aureimonas]|uniref:HWE histidine kinase domain-containing protein n=1 Tax=unclassified Aureimonas TaxID=2615206 RepID=UPI0006FE9CC8|nr:MULTISPECIES: HWE histidine kinase domain-containing protein [unclassified Aureimonas]KQT69800.1 two-component system sensor histidine kinase/response regulator [Aureimonas sp. Leaf427]KQT76048.1 two-component system sensor histidine kinase/response regulator [Aureimonas sp. Leaf460]